MRTGNLIGTLLLAGLSVVAFAMPPHSYLNRPAHTHAQLMRQIQADPVVADRYQRHFGMTKTELVRYFSALELRTQPRSAKARVFLVRENGGIAMKVRTVKKGQKIWVDETGRTILLEVCGNPVTLGPKKLAVTDMATATVVPSNPETRQMDQIVSTPAIVEPAIVASTPTTDFSVPYMPPQPLPPVITSSPSFNPLPLLALVPFFFIRTGDNDKPVPEPVTVGALGVGISLLMVRKRVIRTS